MLKTFPIRGRLVCIALWERSEAPGFSFSFTLSRLTAAGCPYWHFGVYCKLGWYYNAIDID